MAIAPRSNNPLASTSSFGGTRAPQVRGFVPVEPTSDNLVTVMLLGRKSTSRESILQTDAQGKQRPQVLLQLVGVVLPLLDEQGNTVIENKPVLDKNNKPVLDEHGNPVLQQDTVYVCYPDSAKTKLPPVGSVGFKAIMDMPTGIFVESIFAGGVQKIADLADEGYLAGLTGNKVRAAAADGSLNTLLAGRGDFLRSIDGIFTREELLVKHIMSAEKTISITFFGDGEADAFSDSYETLVRQVGFQNVAITACISDTLQATELNSNVSYQPTETHFMWHSTTVGTRQQYMLDGAYAKSGRSYSAQTVAGAANVGDLATRGLDKNYERNVGAIQNGSDIRGARRNKPLIDMLKGGQATPTYSMDNV